MALLTPSCLRTVIPTVESLSPTTGFIRMHHQQHRHAGIAYSERGARTIGHLVASLALIHEVLGAEDMVGHVDFV